MRQLIKLFLFVPIIAWTQTRQVSERVAVNGQENLRLEFDFADQIQLVVWDKQEVLVQVSVEINEGAHNDIFSLSTEKSASEITIKMDKDMWEKIEKEEKRKWCRWQSTINYQVFLPHDLLVDATTISGDFELEYYGTPAQLKTISGAIDITVPEREGFDFRATTISGEIYSDMEIEFPEGKEGLRQIVGQKIKGRVNGGGPEWGLETISGNIYLRKG